MTNLFANAKVVAPKAPPKGSKKVQHVIAGTLTVAQMDVLIKALEAAKDSISAEVKADGQKIYYDQGMLVGFGIDGFEAVEGDATIGIECRKRSTTSALTLEEVNCLTELDIPYGTEVKVPHLYGINPLFAADNDLLAKVSAALDGIVPENFIVVQAEVKKQIVTDNSLAAAYKQKVGMDVFQMLTVMALKPKLANINLAEILVAVKPHLIAV